MVSLLPTLNTQMVSEPREEPSVKDNLSFDERGVGDDSTQYMKIVDPLQYLTHTGPHISFFIQQSL
jgi:hypothetical protein